MVKEVFHFFVSINRLLEGIPIIVLITIQNPKMQPRNYMFVGFSYILQPQLARQLDQYQSFFTFMMMQTLHLKLTHFKEVAKSIYTKNSSVIWWFHCDIKAEEAVRCRLTSIHECSSLLLHYLWSMQLLTFRESEILVEKTTGKSESTYV